MRSLVETEAVAHLAGRWIRLRYSQSFRDQPVRLLLRLHRASGESEQYLLPAAVFGSARWLGHAPADLERLEIVADIADQADIRIDSIEALTTPGLFSEAASRRPVATLIGAVRWPLRNRRGRMLTLQGLLDHAPVPEIMGFAASRRRAVEPDGLDREVGVPGPTIGFAMAADNDDVPAIGRTLASLRSLPGQPPWVRIAAPDGIAARIAQLAAETGLGDFVECVERPAAPSRAAAALAVAASLDAEWVGWLEPGDALAPEAIGAFRSYLRARPQLRLAYADSLVDDGGRVSPRLKPDWSPAFLEETDYVGRPVLWRRDLLARAEVAPDEPEAWFAALRTVSATLTREEAGHLRRVLLTTDNDGRPLARSHPGSATVTGTSFPAERPQGERHERSPKRPSASIVIPTRDRVDLLRRAVDSIRRFASRWSYELVIVDNGSREDATLAYLADLRADDALTVLDRPGPFNFPHLVNEGVASARGETLVLLNNDCEAIAPGWLDRLVTEANREGVGAVGATLLYGDGTLQHAGVEIGLGGEAGHRDRKLPATHTGNLGRMQATHEVSAVTAACLAVRRDLYLDQGGFDPAFAVAFNDVDFCLRLDAAGYRNLLVPDVVLRHAESASRGLDRDGAKRTRFRAEADLFASRWMHRMLADPYGHPLFALDRFTDWLA